MVVRTIELDINEFDSGELQCLVIYSILYKIRCTIFHEHRRVRFWMETICIGTAGVMTKGVSAKVSHKLCQWRHWYILIQQSRHLIFTGVRARAALKVVHFHLNFAFCKSTRWRRGKSSSSLASPESASELEEGSVSESAILIEPAMMLIFSLAARFWTYWWYKWSTVITYMLHNRLCPMRKIWPPHCCAVW